LGKPMYLRAITLNITYSLIALQNYRERKRPAREGCSDLHYSHCLLSAPDYVGVLFWNEHQRYSKLGLHTVDILGDSRSILHRGAGPLARLPWDTAKVLDEYVKFVQTDGTES